MINWFRRNLVNIAVALVISIPICAMAHIERTNRMYTPVVEHTEPIYLELDTEAVTEDTTVKPNEIVEVKDQEISEDDLDLLAHLIHGEAGSTWISDKTLYYVGSVALNRVNSDLFPNTLYEVIYQKGQYACTWDGNFDLEPTERCYRIAEDLLRNGSVLPAKVIWQASFKQGSGVYVYQDNLYFCY